MFRPRTLKFLAVMLVAYALLCAPAYLGEGFLEQFSGTLVLVPAMSIYVFHHWGIPGLLEHNGLCGWGWCSPTPFGYVFLVAFWLLVFWLAAWALATLTKRSKAQ